MPHATHRPPKTQDDLFALPEETRVELIAGEIQWLPSGTEVHQRALGQILYALMDWTRAPGVGCVVGAPFDVRLPSGDVVQPDGLFVSQARRQVIHSNGIHGVPDLAVEVVSPGSAVMDRVVKRALYEKNGIPLYWIVDPLERAVEVLAIHEGSYRAAGWFHEGEVLRCEGLSGFAVAVAELFPR